MPGNLQPLDEKFAIVGQDGRPTLYFIRWAQQRQIDISAGITAEQALVIVQEYLADHPLQAGSGISLSPSGDLNDSPTISAQVQAILDQISTTWGTILFRGTSDWEALAPGTSGHFLKTNGAGADPEWAAASGGSGAWSFVETLTLSAVSSIDSEAWAGAGYKEIMFLIRLETSNDGVALTSQFKHNGAYKTASYRYGIYAVSSSASNSAEGSGSAAVAQLSRSGGTWGIGNATLEGLNGIARLLFPDATGKPKSILSDLSYGVPSAQYVRTMGSGHYEGTDYGTAVEGIRFAIDAGTMTGTIEVYGLT
jgi:hypothetical protein